jgi:hypothetical protein
MAFRRERLELVEAVIMGSGHEWVRGPCIVIHESVILEMNGTLEEEGEKIVTRPQKRSALFGNETRDKMSDKIEICVSN